MKDWKTAAKMLPEHMQEGVIRYIEDGVKPGGFLEAIFANDFVRAVQIADTTNRIYLVLWGEFLMQCPPQCYGNYIKVDCWCGAGGLNGINKIINSEKEN